MKRREMLFSTVAAGAALIAALAAAIQFKPALAQAPVPATGGAIERQTKKAVAPRTDAERWGGADPTPPPADMVEPKEPVLLEYVSDGRIAIITINRPQAKNRLNGAIGVRLSEILQKLDASPSVRVVILTGAGDVFSHGGDTFERKELTNEQWARQRTAANRLFYTLRNFRKPIIAAVNGLALGGGAELVESTDFIIASENAGFGQPEAMIGLSAGGGSPALLPRLLPPGMAMQMLMTGEPISAREAYRLGMVNQVTSRADLMGVTLEIAEKIARNSPTAVQAVKYAVRTGQGQPLEQAIGVMDEAHWTSALHPDRLEGSKAWIERREPKFADSAR